MPLHPSDPIYVVATTVSLGFVLLLFSLLVPGEPVALLAPVARDEYEDESAANDFASSFSPPPSSVASRVNVENVPPPVAKYEWTQSPSYDAPAADVQAMPAASQPSVAPGRPSPAWSAAMADYRAFMPPDEDASVEIEPAHAHEIERTPAPVEAAPVPRPVEPPPRAAEPAPARAAEVAAPVEREPVARPEREPATAGKRKMTWTSLVDDSAEELDMVTRLRIIEALGLVGGSWSREILARAYEQELDATVRGAIFLALRDSKSAA